MDGGFVRVTSYGRCKDCRDLEAENKWLEYLNGLKTLGIEERIERLEREAYDRNLGL